MAIMALISMYIAFLLFTKKTSCGKIMSNIKTLNGSEIGCILMLALLTVISGLLLFELDKNYNTPLINSMFLKAGSLIALVCVGIFIFRENYKIHQFMGIFLVILGMYLISRNTLDF